LSRHDGQSLCRASDGAESRRQKAGKNQKSDESLTEMVGEKLACLEELFSLEVVSSFEVFGLSIVYSSGKELT
jgi:hypothetical protein